MKKSVVLALVLSALLLVTVMAVSVSADASLTLGEITFVKDAANGLVTFTVPYTASEVDQVTVIAVKGPATAAPAPTEANIVYFNQQPASAGNSFTFSVVDTFDATNPYCWIKIGGTSISTASGEGEEIWTEAAPVLVYGDVNDDGAVDSGDAILVIKYSLALESGSALNAVDFPNGTFKGGATVADVNDDSSIDSGDAILIIKYSLALESGSALNPVDFPDGKFKADK